MKRRRRREATEKEARVIAYDVIVDRRLRREEREGANHRFMTNMQRRIYGHATDVAIRPLNEEKAVQAAADLLGELFVAGAAVIFEVQRSSRSEARKEELGKEEMQAMKQRDEDLAREVEILKQKIAEVEQLAKGQGLGGMFNFRHAHSAGDGHSKPI
ncbi:hypothetical protein TEA_009029 [Camellia sinensis var. sinensis]|uniref:OPA3-like protein n=1 Tax=Camellia sinensis var. sinensis TaxID=542762 RepID=A0A4S4DQG6_CAMSN|nr:hypothetical protein TEA_009029 [Camellia sinensis var. sinensis]